MEARAGQARLAEAGEAARTGYERREAARGPEAVGADAAPQVADLGDYLGASYDRAAAERAAGLAPEGVQVAQLAGTLPGAGPGPVTDAPALPDLGPLGWGALRGGALGVGPAALDHAHDLAEDARVRGAAERMGLDAGTPEGLLAADAYEATMEMTAAGLFDCPGIEAAKGTGPEARVMAEAAAVHELAHPGTFDATRNRSDAPADPATLGAVHEARMAALALHRDGAVPVADAAAMAAGAPWSSGWQEGFRALTDDERALGNLPGLTPETRAAPGWRRVSPPPTRTSSGRTAPAAWRPRRRCPTCRARRCRTPN